MALVKMVDGVAVAMTPEEESDFVATQSVPVALDNYRAAVLAHIDGTANQRGYDSGVTCSSYVNSTNTAWAAEAAAFVMWRDAVWAYAYTELAEIESGERDLPTVAEIVDELPAIAWPQ